MVPWAVRLVLGRLGALLGLPLFGAPAVDPTLPDTAYAYGVQRQLARASALTDYARIANTRIRASDVVMAVTFGALLSRVGIKATTPRPIPYTPKPPTLPTRALIPRAATTDTSKQVATNTGMRALPSGPKIVAQWGADTYKHGGLMSTIEPINYRHAFNSGLKDVSRFAEGTSARKIKGYMDEALRTGTPTGRGVVADLGRTIGTDRGGNAVTGLEVIVRDGMIKTAYPVGIP